MDQRIFDGFGGGDEEAGVLAFPCFPTGGGTSGGAGAGGDCARCKDSGAYVGPGAGGELGWGEGEVGGVGGIGVMAPVVEGGVVGDPEEDVVAGARSAGDGACGGKEKTCRE